MSRGCLVLKCYRERSTAADDQRGIDRAPAVLGERRTDAYAESPSRRATSASKCARPLAQLGLTLRPAEADLPNSGFERPAGLVLKHCGQLLSAASASGYVSGVLQPKIREPNMEPERVQALETRRRCTTKASSTRLNIKRKRWNSSRRRRAKPSTARDGSRPKKTEQTFAPSTAFERRKATRGGAGVARITRDPEDAQEIAELVNKAYAADADGWISARARPP